MKNEEFINDVVDLAQSLLKAFPPNKEWIVVNLAKDIHKEAVKPLEPYIGSILYYHFDNVPEFLREQGVFLAITEGKWFVKVQQFRPLQEEYKMHQMYDKISSIVRNKGFFAKGQKVVYFDNRANFVHPFNGQFAVFVVRNELIKFLNTYSRHKAELHIKVQKANIVFNVERSILVINGTEVKIPENTNQHYLCKTIFKNDKSRKTTWSWDEIMEDWKDDFSEDKKLWRKVYEAAREVNLKVKGETMIEKLFITTTKSVKLNPTFL